MSMKTSKSSIFFDVTFNAFNSFLSDGVIICLRCKHIQSLHGDPIHLKMTATVAVHCGAGQHNERLYKKYNKLCKIACKAGVNVLKRGGTAMDAVKAAINVLENCPLTNAGYGSNLTCNGFVETDASIMDGSQLTYGGCGAVKNVKNPIDLAHDLCMKQLQALPLGLVPPALLVGSGALRHAKKIGLKIVPNHTLVSTRARTQYRKYKRLLQMASAHLNQQQQEEAVENDEDSNDDFAMDTVGAVCVDCNGRVAAGCSSGGLLLKRPGRIGQAAIYASGVWADSFAPDTEPSVAVCTSGCGEHLVQTQLAKEIADDLKRCSCPTVALSKSITEKFLHSKFLRNVERKMGGALVLHYSKQTGDVVVLWGHSTGSMSVGYMRMDDQNPRSTMSELPSEKPVGTTVNVGGSYFYNNSRK